MKELRIQWLGTQERIIELATFFVDNVDAEYISHGEIQCGRADAPAAWSQDLHSILMDELRECVEDLSRTASSRVLLAETSTNLMALGFVTIHTGGSASFMIIEDLVVTRARRRGGIGSEVLSWIEAEAARQGISRCFLESGIQNEEAHGFFKQRGFKPVSLVMMKELSLDT